MKSPLFSAKVLLFGEYGIIENSKGLTVPYNYYKGVLKFSDSANQQATNSTNQLLGFYQYLKKIQDGQGLLLNLDLYRMQKDLAKGLYFDSDIPQGYGVGSSGALVASIFDRYSKNKIKEDTPPSKKDFVFLKETFAIMESYFHGRSSGVDPLLCYLNIPLLISQKEISTIDALEKKEGKGAIFLVNSGFPGKTQPMVSIFFEKLKQVGFRQLLKNEFVKYNDACIEAFLKGEFHTLFPNLKSLSHWVFEHLKPMIPKELDELWKNGLKTNAYYLKLCGSGGGGYVLGFTQDFERAKQYFAGHNTEIIHRF